MLLNFGPPLIDSVKMFVFYLVYQVSTLNVKSQACGTTNTINFRFREILWCCSKLVYVIINYVFALETN